MIREATKQDLPAVMQIYGSARAFMAERGNASQWKSHFPPEALLREDIAKHQLYAVERQGQICGVFAFILGKDPTYRRIEGGSWLSEEPYGTIHRLAKQGKERGIFAECVDYCAGKIGHLRIDTHERNLVMQRLIEEQGFQRRGLIYVEDGSRRLAYERLCRQPE